MKLTFPLSVEEAVPFSRLTTLGVGGPARYVARPADRFRARELLDFCREHSLPVHILGQGSNMLVCDQGFDGMVLCYQDRRIERLGEGRLRAGSGGVWDELVALSVAEGLAGIECLSGIPGLVGAAPIQNIGAYGQEVAETLHEVEALDRTTGAEIRFPREQCGFGYRHSHFKGDWAGRYLVTGLVLQLRPGGEATVRYADLRRRLGEGSTALGLPQVRQLVLEIRRSKSMVVDPADPNSRSAGSFFVNPVVPEAEADRIAKTVGKPMPRYPAADGVKLSAAWLMETAGWCRGHVQGRAGLSENHVLALTNRGGATAWELVELAARVRRTVQQRLGVALVPEPNFLGFPKPALELLDEVAEAL
ncbi:MAG: UDP-N-acetylmuramate dehydrogenase [Armatimonadetes bacterium]|nr:UDP-N-acetylmuramate dehydrogenase [Armatimonadota bacterium]